MWKKKIYIKNNLESFPLNRTNIDLFKDCKRCFYISLVKGIRRPHGPPLAINNAVNQLFKKEFDIYRKDKKIHPEIRKLGKNIIPIFHPDLESWRNGYNGIRFLHKKSNFELIANINDLWFDLDSREYVVADYKSSAKKDKITHEVIWEGYWRQLSFFKYLLEKKNLNVSHFGYLVFANARKELDSLDGKLLFNTSIFSKKLDLNWIEDLISEIFYTLQEDYAPTPQSNCKYCKYLELTRNIN